jgi:hypothetical protein
MAILLWIVLWIVLWIADLIVLRIYLATYMIIADWFAARHAAVLGFTPCSPPPLLGLTTARRDNAEEQQVSYHRSIHPYNNLISI